MTNHFHKSPENCKQYCQGWTKSSIECYRRGCVCEGCIINDIIETRCDMKRAVFELVRKFGEPPEDEGLTKTEQKIIDAINAGAETFDEIADYAGITRTSVLTTCQDLYKLAENDGVRYKNRRYMFGQFVKWVRGEYEG